MTRSGATPPSPGRQDVAVHSRTEILSLGRGSMSAKSGRHFLQIPGPTNVPDRVLRALSQPTIDHRGPEFGRLGRQVLEGLQKIFKTAGAVVIYPSSGTG